MLSFTSIQKTITHIVIGFFYDSCIHKIICIEVSPGGPGLLLLAFWFVWSVEDCEEKGFAGVSLEDELILTSLAPSSLS